MFERLVVVCFEEGGEQHENKKLTSFRFSLKNFFLSERRRVASNLDGTATRTPSVVHADISVKVSKRVGATFCSGVLFKDSCGGRA